jgi:periplasmic divalent cation tolerance protein
MTAAERRLEPEPPARQARRMGGHPDSRSCVVVLTTVGGAGDARILARALVGQKLAACVQSVPIASCYVWDGKLAEDAEILLLVKTRAELYPEVEAAIRQTHVYATPEIVCLPILTGSAAYLDWIYDVTRVAEKS